MSFTLSEQHIAKSGSWLVLMTSVLQKQVQNAFCELSEAPVCSVVRGPKMALFENGETLSTPHYLVDAKLETSMFCSEGTFLLPSVFPEVDYRQYAVALDESTRIYHVACKCTVVYKNPSTLAKTDEYRGTSHEYVKKTMKNQHKTVDMPNGFEAMSKEKYTSMPSFGCFAEELPHVSPSSSSVRILEDFKDIFAPSYETINRYDKQSTVSHVLSIAELDSSIIEAGVPTQQMHAIVSGFHSTLESSTRISNVKDSVFLESLLARRGNAEELVMGSKPLRKPNQETDKVFFESLLTSCGPSLDDLPARPSPDKGNSKVSKTGPLSLAQQYTLKPLWADIDRSNIASISSSLDLAITIHTTKPCLPLSELNIDVNLDQIRTLLKDVGTELFSEEQLAELEARSSKKIEVRYFQPIAPLKDALPYELYFPLHPRSPCAFSNGASIELSDDRPLTYTTIKTGSKDDLALVLKQKPLKEFEWLDLAQAVDDSDKKLDLQSSTFSESLEVFHHLGVCTPSIHLPWIDQRQPCIPEIWEDFSICSIVPRSIEAIASGFEHDKNFARVHLPAPPIDTISLNVEQLTETPKDALQAAFEALDIAAVFGGKANDWSDDDDFYTPDSGAEHDSEPVADHTSAKQYHIDDNNTLKLPLIDQNEMLEQPLKVELVEPLLELTVTNSSAPINIYYRLPAPVIKAINLEFVRLQNSEIPWNMVVEDQKTYEQALANIKPHYDDIPHDILFWLHEVNCEFSRLCLEGPRDGGAWNLDYHFEQIMALALSNVEWHYFSYMLKKAQHPDFVRRTLEAAQCPKEWLLNMLGVAAQYQDYRSCDSKALEEGKSKAGYYPACELHHINFNGDYVYKQSCTPPAVSFWAIRTTTSKQLCDMTNPLKAPPGVHLKSVLSAQAFKYVDPVKYCGTNKDVPKDAHGHYLTGSQLRDAVTNEVDVIYQPCGSWREDEYSQGDVIPSQATQGDEYHHASMPEYVILQRPYHIDPNDDQHDLQQFNGQAHLNPNFVSTRALKHSGSSPLAQVWCIDDFTRETSDIDVVAIGEPIEELVGQIICLSAAPVDGNDNVKAVIEAGKVPERQNISNPTAGDEYEAVKAAAFEAAWNAWEIFEQDSDPEDAEEEGIPNVRNGFSQIHVPEKAAFGLFSSAVKVATPQMTQKYGLVRSKPSSACVGKNVPNSRVAVAGDAIWDSKLRPHRFFDVVAPEVLAPNLDLFPTQRLVEGDIAKVIQDLPYFSSDDKEVVQADTTDTAGLRTQRKSSPYSNSSPGEVLSKQPSQNIHTSGKKPAVSATDNFTQVFGDRAQPTPPKPCPRGSLGHCVLGVLYVCFGFGKWMPGNLKVF